MTERGLGDVAASFAVETSNGTLSAPNASPGASGRIFGGQLLAQAMGAAASSSLHTLVRSLHLTFCAQGSPEASVTWSVEEIHTGRSFSTRLVQAHQHDRLLATGVVTMHASEDGLDHQIVMPEVSGPDELVPIEPGGAVPIEMRVVGESGFDDRGVGAPELYVWMRWPAAAPRKTSFFDQQLLAYCSDATMLATAMRPHEGVAFGARSVVASAVTAHSVVFHRPFSASEWMLFAQCAPSAHGARAYMRGDWFDQAGALVASCAQEGLIRVAADTPDRPLSEPAPAPGTGDLP